MLPSTFIPYVFSPSRWYQVPRQDLFCSPVLSLFEKEMTFCLFKITTQGVSL
jgi:hypothetical protein